MGMHFKNKAVSLALRFFPVYIHILEQFLKIQQCKGWLYFDALSPTILTCVTVDKL